MTAMRTARTWENSPSTASPLSATNLNTLDGDLSKAYAGEGCVDLDSFSGANDDAKLTTALTYLAAQTQRQWLRIPARTVTFSTGGRVPFNGLKIVGPNTPHNKNLEIEYAAGGSAPVNHKIRLTCGNGTSSWFNGTGGEYYDVIFKDLAFHGNSNTQMWHQPTGTLYSCTFDSLTSYGMYAMFGNESSKCLLTQTVFSGHWTAVGIAGTQFHIGGSDNSFWMDGFINIGSPGGALAAGGRPQMIFDSLSKTNFGYIYCTLEGDDDYGGIRLNGNNTGSNTSGGCTFFGGAFEGRNVTSEPGMRPAIRILGGNWTFVGGWFGQISSTANASGAVEQTGGHATFYSPTYMRCDPTPATFPFLYQTGGTARIVNAIPTRGEQIRVRWADTTTYTIPVPANSAT